MGDLTSGSQKQRPPVITNSLLSSTLFFSNSRHLVRCVPCIAHCSWIVLLTKLSTLFRPLPLLSFVVSRNFLTLFKTSGERTGSFAKSNSSLTNLAKDTFKPDFFPLPYGGRHHLTPEYDGNLALTWVKVGVESSSPLNPTILTASWHRKISQKGFVIRHYLRP